MTRDSFVPRTVLVHVGLDLIGDGILKLPFLRCLRGIWPDAHVTWLCGKGASVYTGPLAGAVQGLVDEVIEHGAIGQRKRELIGPKPLNGRAFDLVIDTQRGPLATLVLRRIPHRRFISPAARFLFSDRRPAGKPRTRDMLRQMLDLLELAAGCEVPTPPDNLIAVPDDVAAAARAVVPADRVCVGLAPGAGGRHKCWPLERFIEVARGQEAAGRQPVFLLGPAESAWVEDLRAAVPGALFPLQDAGLVGARGLTPFVTIAVCRAMGVTVCNDAGVGHLAAASGAPVVLLYGPTSPRKFAPLSSRRRIVQAQDFGGAGMADIPVAAVTAAIDDAVS